jgi:hypothetical protein
MMADFADSFGVNVNDDDRKYWKSTFDVVRAFDDIIDEDHNQDIKPYLNEVISGRPVSGLDKAESQQFAEVYSGLSRERKNRFTRACLLGDFALKRYNSSNINEYIQNVLDESDLLADIMKIEESGVDEKNREEFNKWLPSVSRAGYAVDTAVDLSSDFDEGVTRVEPSLGAYGKLMYVIGDEVIRCLIKAKKPIKIISIFTKIIFEKSAKYINKMLLADM